MIIIGVLFIAMGIAVIVGLSIWPALLIGLGTGMVLSGVLGKFGWEPLGTQWGLRRGRKLRRHPQELATSGEPAR